MTSSADEPYQLFQPLPAQAYQALKADIAQRGVLVPIEVDEDGVLLDGHHRVRAWRELVERGVRMPDPPVVVRRGLDDGAKRVHALKANLLRRQLGPIGWAIAFAHLLQLRGAKRGQGVRNDLVDSPATLVSLAAEVGVLPRTARYRLELARVLAADPDLAARVDAGTLSVRRARQYARERHPSESTADPRQAAVTHMDLRLGDFVEALGDIPDASVDLIFTDPPYGRAHLPQWERLGRFAARVLRPGGLLATQSGQAHLPVVLDHLRTHLQYIWTIAVVLETGPSTALPSANVFSRWKPVLLFGRAPCRQHPWLDDVVRSDRREKEWHAWQQSLMPTTRLLERLSRPSETVVDPFLGSGTTAVAIESLGGRRFIGAEIDPHALALARTRLSGSGTPLASERIGFGSYHK